MKISIAPMCVCIWYICVLPDYTVMIISKTITTTGNYFSQKIHKYMHSMQGNIKLMITMMEPQIMVLSTIYDSEDEKRISWFSAVYTNIKLLYIF